MIKTMLAIIGLMALLWQGNAMAAPPCVPLVTGTPHTQVGDPIIRADSMRAYAYWHCEDPATRERKLHYSFCVFSQDCFGIDQVTGAIRVLSLDGPKRAAELARVWQGNTFDCATISGSSTPREIGCNTVRRTIAAEAAAWRAALPPPAPVDVWEVRPASGYTTRPAYTWIDGVRGTKEVARVAAGTKCIRIVQPSTASTGWGLYTQAGDRVVSCAKVAP